MKRINLPSQLLLIVFTTLLIASFAFSTASISYSSVMIEREVYNTLSSYVMLVNEDTKEPISSNMNISYYVKTEEKTNEYVGDFEYVHQHLEEIITEYKKKYESDKPLLIKSRKIVEKHKMYIVISTKDNFNTYSMVFTDNSYSQKMIRDVVMKMNGIFFVILLLSIVIIFLWSNNITRRLKNIQNNIINLPKNNYQSTYTDEYQDEIGELSRSVDKMRIELSENERIKQEMLHNLSHDFKTPIAVIKSYAEAIDDGVEDKDVALNKIIEQADLLKNKVNKLIEYNKIEYFTKDKEFEDINISEIIEDIILNYKHQLNDINIELDIDNNVTFRGYKENWYIVIDNIIDNAKRYAKNTIKIVLKQDRLRIYNDGDHIDEKFINNQFKPYEKGSNGQFGLGMSIVQKTVDFFGMNLNVVNEEIGVSFIIEKPRRK